MPPLGLRPLGLDEHATVAGWAMAEGWPGRSKHVALTPEEFSVIAAMPGHASFAMSEAGGPVLGFGQVWTSPAGVVSLVRIIVDPALRGRGLGLQLSGLLLQEARRIAGGGPVKLRVRRDNAPALSVYSALGFRVLDDESNAEVLAMVCG